MTVPTRMQDLLLGLDVGTSAIKAGLFTRDGVLLRSHRVPLAMRSPRPGYVELEADEVWDAVVSAARGLLEEVRPLAVAGVAVAAAAPTPLLVDDYGAVLSPVCTFADARAAREVRAVASSENADSYRQLTGNPTAVPTCSLLTGAHLASAQTAGRVRFGHLTTFVLHRLTGQWVMDPTNAAYTGGVDLRRPTEWSEEALSVLAVSGLVLPEIVASASPAGPLLPHAAKALGLPAGIQVATGSADTAAAALAVGCVEGGNAFESVGTSGVLTVCREEPLQALHAMNRPHVIPGRWLSHAAMSSSGAAVAWVRQHLQYQGHVGLGLAEISEFAASSPVGANGVVFLPYLAGERSPVWDPSARGAWVGMTLTTTAADLARSVFEGAAYGLRQLLDLEADLTGATVPEFVSVGGGANSAFWCSVKADVTQRIIHRDNNGNVAARGAALLAGCAAGLHSDPLSAARTAGPIATSAVEPAADTATRTTYDRMYAVYRQLYPALKDLFVALVDAAPPPQSIATAGHAPARQTDNREGEPCVGPA